MEVFILCIFLLTQRHVSDFNWVFLTEKKIIFLNEMIDNYTWQYMYKGTDFNMKIYQFFHIHSLWCLQILENICDI